MDFTREPIIETIITPKEGSKLAVRNSKSGQEEFFVDAVEVVCFGQALFFRSLEKPKPFLVPVADYEVLEVKEARLVLKHAGPEKAIKIGGGREPSIKPSKEVEKTPEKPTEEVVGDEAGPAEVVESSLERRRDRRRPVRKRKQREEIEKTSEEEISEIKKDTTTENTESPESGSTNSMPPTGAALQALLAPPPLLISETIGKYRQDTSFKGAFFLTEEEYTPHSKVEELLAEEEEESLLPPIPKPANLGMDEEPLFFVEDHADESMKEPPGKSESDSHHEKRDDTELPF